MKSTLLTLFSCFIAVTGSFAQVALDTLAIQDFETIPATPTWTYTGTLADTQTGYAATGTCIPGTPLGIGGSTAWHVASQSGGNPIVFDNIAIPTGYDSIRMNFRLAGLCLTSTSGGPDNLDYVLVEYSLDGGATYSPRIRVRGAINNNSFWAYDATGVASVYYLPGSEVVYQPTNTGLAVADGYSFVQINFPGSISQLQVRITPRSSTTSDSWLVDNVLLTGEVSCTPSSSSITATACDSYTAPSGAVYTSSGSYTDVIPNVSGCDSTINIALTVNNSSSNTDVITACDSLTWIDGNTYTANNNTASYVLTNSNGCDSTVYLDLTINAGPDLMVIQSGANLTANQLGATYQWVDCDNNNTPISGATSQSFAPTVSGNYAVEVTLNGCTGTSDCANVDFTGIDELTQSEKTIVGYYDLFGRVTEFVPNTPLLVHYSDGSVERIMVVK